MVEMTYGAAAAGVAIAMINGSAPNAAAASLPLPEHVNRINEQLVLCPLVIRQRSYPRPGTSALFPGDGPGLTDTDVERPRSCGGERLAASWDYLAPRIVMVSRLDVSPAETPRWRRLPPAGRLTTRRSELDDLLRACRGARVEEHAFPDGWHWRHIGPQRTSRDGLISSTRPSRLVPMISSAVVSGPGCARRRPCQWRGVAVPDLVDALGELPAVTGTLVAVVVDGVIQL